MVFSNNLVIANSFFLIGSILNQNESPKDVVSGQYASVIDTPLKKLTLLSIITQMGLLVNQIQAHNF